MIKKQRTRRDFIRDIGLSAGILPFLSNLQSVGFAQAPTQKKRMIVMFSPNGIVPKAFWPDEEGELKSFKEILSPLEPFRKETLVLNGVCDKIKGDGDNHMRGMGCLLTGSELFPGNIQGGSHTPAGWASGISIDQELKTFLQKNPETRTRHGSLEFGVMVPDRADTWTRMSYAGPNKPVAPIDNPYQMFNKLYGRMKDRESLTSVLDDLQEDMLKLDKVISKADRQLLEEHTQFVRDMERELQAGAKDSNEHPVPKLEKNIDEVNDNMPKITRMQVDLLVNSFMADFSRIATFQITNSVGQAKMRWIGIKDGHHSLSHKPDSDQEAQEKLIKINKWYCEQLAYLAKRLKETPEPNGQGSLLDNTTIVWSNELGKGNSHTLNDIPFVMVGGGLGFKMGQSIKYKRVAHNRLLMSFAHAFGHQVKHFGNADFCGDGALNLT